MEAGSEEAAPGEHAGRRGGRPRPAPLYKRLPRGPHRLDRHAVAQHQRVRIQGAMVQAVAGRGLRGGQRQAGDRARRRLAPLLLRAVREQAGVLPRDVRHDRRQQLAAARRALLAAPRAGREASRRLGDAGARARRSPATARRPRWCCSSRPAGARRGAGGCAPRSAAGERLLAGRLAGADRRSCRRRSRAIAGGVLGGLARRSWRRGCVEPAPSRGGCSPTSSAGGRSPPKGPPGAAASASARCCAKRPARRRAGSAREPQRRFGGSPCRRRSERDA